MQITLCGLRLEVLSQARAKIISKDGKFGLEPTPEKVPRKDVKLIELPQWLHNMVLYYIQEFRPVLLKDENVVTLWIAKTGTYVKRDHLGRLIKRTIKQFN